jgi:hypothetical protein
VDEDDVEGHMLAKAIEPEGQHGARRVDEDDVEGHMLAKAIEPEGQHGARRVDEDDVEGHVGRIQSPKSRGE